MKLTKIIKSSLIASAAALSFGANAAIINTTAELIAAPTSVADDAPGAINTHIQGFDEIQNYTLLSDLAVNGGNISAGTTVSSHMIFLNSAGNTRISDSDIFEFDGDILGIMTDSKGLLEAASNAILGASGTFYPGSFNARGLEGGDSVSYAGNTLNISMVVTEPGDWIRVVTAANVPEPGSLALFGLGLAGIAAARRKNKQ